jgi:signal transduction histidine kinase
MEAVIFYHPAYRFAALLKAVTAVASWATVFALFRIAPAALKLPGLSRANDELQLQLQNTRRAEEALARSNQDLESFTGLVTHDLRNPLHSALLRSEIAREAMDRGDAALAASQLRLAMESMYQMEALVRELHAEAVLRHHTTEMGMLPLSTVISAARTNLAPLISSSGARIVLGSLPEVRASRTMLIQLFINLFENSIKYRSDESPLIEITASAQAGHAVIRVSDNCIGIPPHERERVFQSGVRGSQTASLPGSGLGLSFCQGIMQAHGGSITVVDNTGTGARVIVRQVAKQNLSDGHRCHETGGARQSPGMPIPGRAGFRGGTHGQRHYPGEGREPGKRKSWRHGERFHRSRESPALRSVSPPACSVGFVSSSCFTSSTFTTLSPAISPR